MLKVLFHTTDN